MIDRERHAITIYTVYERFWHWTQALLIFVLAFTGFGLHGIHGFMEFETAVTVHTFAAIALILLWIFTTFWNFTTGNWRQFLPNTKGLFVVIHYYAWGILFGEEHPHKKTLRRKQNALQGLAYLTFMVLIGPALWLSGIVYMSYDLWNTNPSAVGYLYIIAGMHTLAAFLMVAFVIIHVYMTTTGKTPLHYIKTMITGVENVELTEVEMAYLEQEYPNRIKDDEMESGRS